MSKILFLILICPFLTFSPSADILSKDNLIEIYSQAIGDFIKTANKKNNTSFDTLFIGKRVNGKSDDFPDIDLPKVIENTQIRIISPEAGQKSQNEKKSRIYINLIGWINKENAEFIFVVFSNGFMHQYDLNLNYKFKRNRYELEKIQFKGPPFSL